MKQMTNNYFILGLDVHLALDHFLKELRNSAAKLEIK